MGGAGTVQERDKVHTRFQSGKEETSPKARRKGQENIQIALLSIVMDLWDR
jgi:hypothetical protein